MPSSQRRQPKRVLIYRLGSLGDTVVALPAFHLIARAFPDAERQLLTSYPPAAKAPPSSAVLENTGLVQGYFRYTYGTRSFGELLKLWWRIASWRPDVLVYLNGPRGVASAKRDGIFFRICGISRIIGLPVTEDMQQPRPNSGSGFESPFVPGFPLEFECSRLVRNLAELGDAQLDEPGSWDLHLTESEHSRAIEVLRPAGNRPVIAASIGTKMQAKDWGRENWRLLVTELAKLYPGHCLALCGAPEESEASEFVAEGWRAVTPSPAINLCGALTPRQSAALFQRAELFIGHDSGPMHLAVSVQTPCVAIFSARNLPRVWFPYGSKHRILYHNVDCQGCNLETCIVQGKKCLASISVNEVLATIKEQLGSPEFDAPMSASQLN